MANLFSPFGLKPVMELSGSPKLGKYYIASNDANVYAIGTPVTLAGDSSSVDEINGAYQVQGTQTITLATGGDGNKLLGAIVGFDVVPLNYTSAGSGINPANQERIAIVSDDPNQIYEAVCASALTATEMSRNANLTIGAVNTSTKVDSTAINATTGTSATFQLKLLGLAPEPGNTFAANGKYRAKINNHCYGNVVVGVA